MAIGVLKNTYFSSINIYFEYLIGLFISILIARALGPDEFGVYSYLVKVAGICIILTNAGINTGAIKFIAEARAQGNEQHIPAIYAYFRRIQVFKTVIVTGALTALVLFAPGLVIEDKYSDLLAFLIFAIVFKSGHMYRVGVFKGYERFDFLAFTVLIVAPLNLACVFGVLYFDPSLINFYMLFTGVAFLYWSMSGLFLKRLAVKKTAAQPILSDALRVRISHHLKIVSINTVVSGLAIGQCEILLLKYFATNEAISFFYIAMTIAGAALLLVPGVYSSVLLPIIARSVAGIDNDPSAKIKQSTRYLFVLGVLVGVPTCYYGEGIVVLLYGEEFSQAGVILGLFALVGIFNAYREPVNAYLLSVDKQSLMLKLSVFAFFLSISLNAVLISQWGLFGAVTAYTSVALILTIVMVCVAYYYLKIRPEFKKLILIALSAIVALIIASQLASFLIGILELFVGFIIFGVLYPLFLILLNALDEKDYKVMLQLASKLGNKAQKILNILIVNRLKL
ncbi:MAG: polysaccharide biosynthesis C-terminal domain-containing protein [Oleiphilus sp.]